MSQFAQVEALEVVIDMLPEKDRGFAKSLVDQAKRRTLSEKQMYWVDRLRETALNPPKVEEKPKSHVASMKSVFEMFQKSKLQSPRVELMLDGGVLAIYPATSASKYAGQLQLTDGKPYGQNTWYGVVDKEGVWTRSKAGETAAPKIRALLNAFAADPAKVAAEHGKLMGRCCFCQSSLENEKSTSVGYGPVCAKRWGLPWGKK